MVGVPPLPPQFVLSDQEVQQLVSAVAEVLELTIPPVWKVVTRLVNTGDCSRCVSMAELLGVAVLPPVRRQTRMAKLRAKFAALRSERPRGLFEFNLLCPLENAAIYGNLSKNA